MRKADIHAAHPRRRRMQQHQPRIRNLRHPHRLGQHRRAVRARQRSLPDDD
jgi:hypothetical protein